MLLDVIKQNYIDKHKNNIFATKITDVSYEYYILYSYDYEFELENFKKEFLYYLPYYVSNDDLLKTINVDENIDNQLEHRSKKIRKNSTIIPKRQIQNDGIYGELFLDFYLRIVKNRELFITYVSKRNFNSNYESTGIDSVAYYVEGDELNICFSEAKFVSDASGAKKELQSDIDGNEEKNGHLTQEFINNYIQFIIENGPKIKEEDKTKFNGFIEKLNLELYEGKNFLDILISEQVCINFIFFAIFKSSYKTPVKLKSHYNDIMNSAKSKIESMSITNYKIEIVFIPTNNESMIIKRKIETNYE